MLLRDPKLRDWITLETHAGDYIGDVCVTACRIATALDTEVEFEFNDVQMRVSPFEIPEVVYKRWNQGRETMSQQRSGVSQ